MHKKLLPYVFLKEIIFFLLAIISIGLIIFETTHHLYTDHGSYQWLFTLDFVIALLFLSDFMYGFFTTTDKKLFFKERWWELLASIPLTYQATQLLRGLGVLRLLRIVRVITRIRRIETWVDSLSFKIFNLTLMSGTLIVLASVMFYSAEFGINENIHTYSDSIWWTVSTITTSGLGDIVPVTMTGRIIGMLLMLSGVVIFGILVNYITKDRYKNIN